MGYGGARGSTWGTWESVGARGCAWELGETKLFRRISAPAIFDTITMLLFISNMFPIISDSSSNDFYYSFFCFPSSRVACDQVEAIFGTEHVFMLGIFVFESKIRFFGPEVKG